MCRVRLYINQNNKFKLIDEKKVHKLKKDKCEFEEKNNRENNGKVSILEH